MEIKIEAYTIKTMDEYNFGLFKTRPKGAFRGKTGDGDTEVHIGYYGTLGSALHKLVSDRLLSDEGLNTAMKVQKALKAVESNINEAFKDVRPKHV